MSIYILVKWSLFQIKDRGETKNIANKHLFRLTAASCNPLSTIKQKRNDKRRSIYFIKFSFL